MKSKYILIILISVGLISCRKSSEFESPSQAIAGDYEAETYNNGTSPLINYPINGETMRLQIQLISKDSVSVNVSSSVNGFYSPGSSALYPSVFVAKKTDGNGQFAGLFMISLAPPIHAGTLENSIWFDQENNAYYTFVPPNYTKGAVQAIFTKSY
jgi:hypothetical protein